MSDKPIIEDCPNCPNQGFWVDANYYTGEPEQVQCQFCYENKNSVFNNQPKEVNYESIKKMA